VTAAASHAAATAAAKSAPTATPAAASKRVAGDGCTCQRQSGNKGDNLVQTKILHCRLPFHSMCWIVPRLA
jgi:hypothetical protein